MSSFSQEHAGEGEDGISLAEAPSAASGVGQGEGSLSKPFGTCGRQDIVGM